MAVSARSPSPPCLAKLGLKCAPDMAADERPRPSVRWLALWGSKVALTVLTGLPSGKYFSTFLEAMHTTGQKQNKPFFLLLQLSTAYRYLRSDT